MDDTLYMLDYVLSFRRLKFKVFFWTLSKLIKTWICCSKHNKRIIWLKVLLFSIFLMLFLMSLVPYVSYIIFIQFVLEIVFWNSILFQSIQNTLLLIQWNSFVFEKSDLITANHNIKQRRPGAQSLGTLNILEIFSNFEVETHENNNDVSRCWGLLLDKFRSSSYQFW